MPDCDEFARVVGPRGKAVVSSLHTALEQGVPADEYALAQLCEAIWRAAGGASNLDSLLQSVRQPELSLGEEPAPPSNSTFDLVVARAVARAIIRGETSDQEVTERVACDVVFHHVVHAKGGLLEALGPDAVFVRSEEIRGLISPVARSVAAALVANPRAVELRISQDFNDTTSRGMTSYQLA